MPSNGSVPDTSPGEVAYLKVIHQVLEGQPINQGIITANGDDAFCFTPSPGCTALITTDMSIEGVHFSDQLTHEDRAFRSMTANLSDIIAMGGYPVYAVISLGLPRGFREKEIEQLYHGFRNAAEPAGCHIAGGDLTKSDKLVISITVYGETHTKPVNRSGAAPGEHLYLTGSLGRSLAGLKILIDHEELMDNYPSIIQIHLRPVARFDIIEQVMRHYTPTAMIDISDGLSTDLHRLCNASGTGAQIMKKNLPVHPELAAYCAHVKEDPYHYAYSSGEEYELLFTSKKDMEQQTINGIEINPIGTITTQKNIVIDDGVSLAPLEPTGFDHFTEKQ